MITVDEMLGDLFRYRRFNNFSAALNGRAYCTIENHESDAHRRIPLCRRAIAANSHSIFWRVRGQAVQRSAHKRQHPATSAGATRKHCKGLEQYSEVHPKMPILDVLQIELEAATHVVAGRGGAAAAADLSEAGDPGRHEEPALIVS
jgi:hypothetical protein